MMFDNAQFEKGVASTLASLKGLEQGLTLKDGVSGIEKVQAAADKLSFSGAEQSISGLSSALGGLKDTAVNVFDHITSGIGTIAKGYALVKGIFSAGIGAMAIQGGWSRASNLNKAAFKLDAMGVGWKNVSESVSKAVDGTAYSLDAAATSAALFASSGVKAGDDMTRALKATANLASISGSSFEHIGDIMAKVAAQGKLTGMQIDSFMFAGIDVAGILKSELNLTQEGFEQLKKEGISLADWVDVIMNRFGDAAGLANNSFDGAMGNMRSALNRTFADLFQYGQQGMIPVFNAIRESINTVNGALKPLLGAKWTWFDPAQGKEIERQGVLIEGFVGVMEEASKAIEGFGGYWDDATGKRHYNSEFFNRTNRIVKMFAEGLMGPIAEIKAGTRDLVWGVLRMGASGREIFRLAAEFLSPIGLAFHDLFGDGSFAKATAAFNQGASHILETLADLHVATGFINIARTAFQALFGVLKGAGGAVFNAIGGAIQGFVTAISGVGVFVGHLVDMFDRMNRAGVGAADAFSIAMMPIINMTKDIPVIGALVQALADLPKGISAIIDAAAGNDGAFERLSSFISEHGAKIAKIGDDVGNAFRTIGGGVYEFANKAGGFLAEKLPLALDKLKEGFQAVLPILGVIPFAFSQLGEKIQTFSKLSGFNLESLTPFIEGIGKSFSVFFEDLSNGVVDLPQLGRNIGNCLSIIGGRFSNFASQVLDELPAPLQNFFHKLGEIGDVIGSVAGKIVEPLGRIKDAIGNAMGSVHFDFGWIDGFLNATENLLKRFYEGDINFEQLAMVFAGNVRSAFDSLGKSISDGLGSFWRKLQENINVATFGQDIGGWLAERLGLSGEFKLPELPDISLHPLETLKNVFKAIQDFAGSLTGMDFSSFKERIKSVADAIKDFDLVGKVLDFVKSIGDKLSSMSGVLDVFSGLKDALTHPFETIGSFLAGIANGLGSGIDTFLDKLDAGKIGKLVGVLSAIGIAAGVIVALKKIGDLLETIGKIGEIGGSIKGAIDGLGDCFSQLKKNLKARMVKDVAQSIAILVGSLIAIATYPDKDKLWEALPLIGIITAVMVGLTILFGKLSAMESFDFSGVGEIAEAMRSLVTSVIMVGAAIALFGSMGADTLGKGGAIVMGIVILFGALTAAMSQLGEGTGANISAFGTSMADMAKALLGIYIAVELFGRMDTGVMMKGMAAVSILLVVMGAVAGLMSLISGFSKNSKDLTSVAAPLLSMAVVMVVMQKVIAALGEMDPATLDQGMKAMYKMAAVISALALVMTLLGLLTGLGGGKSVAVTLLAMSVAIGIFALAIGGLALMFKSGMDVWGALAVFALGILAIAGAMALVGTFAPQMAGAAAAMLALTIAVAGFTAIILALAAVPWQVILQGIVNVSMILGVFLLALLGIGAIGEFVGAGLLAVSGAFALFGVAMVAIAAALFVGVAALAAFTAISGAFIPAFESFTNALIACFNTEDFVGSMIGMSVAMALLGAACLILGVGLGVLSLAVWAFGAVFPEAVANVTTALTALANFFSTQRETLANGVKNALGGVIDGIVSFGGDILEKAKSIPTNMKDGMTSNEGEIRSGVATLISTLGNLLWTAITGLGPILLNLLKEIGLGLLEGIAEAVTGPIEWLDNKFYEWSGGLMGHAAEAEVGAEAIADSTAEGIASRDEDLGASTKEQLDNLVTDINGTASEAGVASQGMADAIANPLEAFSGTGLFERLGLTPDIISQGADAVKGLLSDKGIEIPDSIAESITTGSSEIDVWGAIQANGNVDLSQFATLMGEGATEGGDAFETNFDSRMNDVDIMSIVANAADIDVETLKENFSGAAAAAATAFSDGFAENMQLDGSGPMEKAAASIEASSGNMKSAGASIGTAVNDGFKSSAKKMKSSATGAAKDAVNAVKGQKGSAQSGGNEVGYNMGAGLKSGLRSGSNGLAALAASIVASAVAAMKRAAKEKSPSRETIWISEMMMQGLMVGFDNLRANVVSSAESVMKDSLSAMSDASYIAGLLDDIDDQPTIRPVLDLTDYEAGIHRMQGLNASAPMNSAQWANRATGVSSNGGYYNNSNRSMVINLNYGAGTSAADMVNEMAMILQTKNLMEA